MMFKSYKTFTIGDLTPPILHPDLESAVAALDRIQSLNSDSVRISPSLLAIPVSVDKDIEHPTMGHRHCDSSIIFRTLQAI